ncbi:MAG: hypothetical protein IIB65_00945 [Proteobacteria bacterium]|nr:hypothetical protein [Pseudomonadota bacterium]
MRTRSILLSLGLASLSAVVLSAPALAASGAAYFKGKTITYIVATGAGGGYDFYGRLISEYMERALPGSTIIVKNVPGAGHMIGASQIYNSKANGLTIGTFNTGLIYQQVIGRKGIKFDLAKMSWIGKASSDPRVLMASIKSEVKTLADLRRETATVMSTSGVGSSGYNDTKMLAKVLNWNIKLVLGYRGMDSEMAMRRGEIDAAVSSRSSADLFVKNGFGRIIFQVGGTPPEGVPLLKSLVKGEDARSIAALIGSQGELARLTAGPPGISADRLAALRSAYRKALTDPEFIAKAKKASRPVDPLFGEDVAKKIKAALQQSPETVALVRKILNVKPPSIKVGPIAIEVQKKGRFIVFTGPDGKKVKSKVSGSRTKIKIAGKKANRKKLKTGMKCKIDYKPGGRNEPKTLDCE